MELLEAFLVNTVICKFCKSSCGLQLWEDGNVHGWSSEIGLECQNRKCKAYNTFCTSRQAAKTAADSKNYTNVKEINR